MIGVLLIAFGIQAFSTSGFFFSVSKSLDNFVELMDNTTAINIVNAHSESIKNEAWTWIGIGLGLILSGISFIFNGLKDVSDLRKTRDFLNEDFENINNKQIEIIPKLEGTLENLQRDQNSIYQFLGENTPYVQIMVDHLPVMHFSLWDSAVSNLKDLDAEEQKKIFFVHDYIVRHYGYLQRANDPLIPILSHLASSSRSNGSELSENRKILIKTFEYNLSVSKNVYSELQKLKDIKWIKSDNWKILETKSVEREYGITGAPIR